MKVFKDTTKIKVIINTMLLIPALCHAAPQAIATAHIDMNPGTIAYVGVTKDIPVFAKIFISNDSAMTQVFNWVIEVCPRPNPNSCHSTKGQMPLAPGQNYSREYPMTIKVTYPNAGHFVTKMSVDITGGATAQALDTKTVVVKN